MKFMSNADKIQGFEFAYWLQRMVSENDFVVMKMDVEGTEFHLIPRLLQTGAMCLIDEMFLECHYNRWQRCCPGIRSPKYKKTYPECLDLFCLLRTSDNWTENKKRAKVSWMRIRGPSPAKIDHHISHSKHKIRQGVGEAHPGISLPEGWILSFITIPSPKKHCQRRVKILPELMNQPLLIRRPHVHPIRLGPFPTLCDHPIIEPCDSPRPELELNVL
ncbi:hypothetical protein RJ641_008882 [Dillenia turbinata]|uniref:DUF7870 domain-containing protein n=1 Tax=Dillenia turbinata TaxID=194707 RepID=A0AAN8VGG0_9MAGN